MGFPTVTRRARLAFTTLALVLLTLYLGFNIEDVPSSYRVGAKPDFHQDDSGRTPPSTSLDHDARGSSQTNEEAMPPDPPKLLQPPQPPSSPPITCLKFEELQKSRPGPFSEGKRQFPLVRPPPECRTFRLPSLEALLKRMKRVIKDPDLYRLFENSYPNTLDTMIKWKGYARKPAPPPAQNAADGGNQQQSKFGGLGPETDEELTYVITGDIDAMWLRDSASQIYSYLTLLEADSSKDSLASLWRGLINSHSRYIITSPYCHSFQPPAESGIPPTHNGAFTQNNPQPGYNPVLVFDCKWELDSLASFLQISAAYHQRTGDLDFFGRYRWAEAVRAAVDAAAAMRLGTYDDKGRVEKSAWTFTGWTNRGSETLTNDGLGNPSRGNGMVRTAFRPSDDATIFQFLVPANMMFAKYLEEASLISEALSSTTAGATTAGAPQNETLVQLTADMRSLARGIRQGIDKDAVVTHRDFGEIFAYEVDGFGGANLMDDANVPSLLAMPLWDFSRTHSGGRGVSSSSSSGSGSGSDSMSMSMSTSDVTAPVVQPSSHNYDIIYQNTRRFILSDANPYYAKGPVISAVGGPHIGPGKAWPMAAIIAGMTAYDVSAMKSSNGSSSSSSSASAIASDAEVEKLLQDEVAVQLRMVLDSTDGTGVVHESVNSWNVGQWSRAWFGWANGLLGELILRIEQHENARQSIEKGLLSRSWQ